MSTYTPVASQTLSANATNVTFYNVPQDYTDLVLVVSYASTANDNTLYMKVGNGSVDTGSNYSTTIMYGNGTTAASTRQTSQSNGIWLAGLSYGCSSSIITPSTAVINFVNYSNSNTYKTVLTRAAVKRDDGNGETDASVGLWRSTSAINTISITFISGSLLSGSTFSLYGIQAGTPKAQGGQIVTTDGTYWYHAFTASGTFTPSTAITADVLVVAGGGAGGKNGAGGGGAGGIFYATSQSLSANTSLSCIVGAGGASNTAGGIGFNGTNSQFASLTVAIGGGGGGSNIGPVNGASGGSGGGSNASSGGTGGSSTQTGTGGTGYGSAGGNYVSSNSAGGGGGAGQAGNTNGGSRGGDGLNTWSTWATATNTGVSGYYAGGGGGASNNLNATGAGGLGGGGGDGVSGTVNTGSGGGAPWLTTNSGAGGSGIVIIRYAV